MVLAQTEAELRRAFVPHSTPSKVFIDFRCDSSSDRVREIVFESGEGHEGTFQIIRISRGSGYDTRYGVRALAMKEHCDDSASACGPEFADGEIRSDALEPTLERIRTAIIASAHAVPLRPAASFSYRYAQSTSSRDFHLRLRVTGDNTASVERTFTGYDGDSEDSDRIAMLLATKPLRSILPKLAFAQKPPTEDDRRFFSAQFLLTVGSSSWWVRERYVALAQYLGNREIVPLLEKLASSHPSANASGDRTRVTALAAIGAIMARDTRAIDLATEGPADCD